MDLQRFLAQVAPTEAQKHELVVRRETLLLLVLSQYYLHDGVGILSRDELYRRFLRFEVLESDDFEYLLEQLQRSGYIERKNAHGVDEVQEGVCYAITAVGLKHLDVCD